MHSCPLGETHTRCTRCDAHGKCGACVFDVCGQYFISPCVFFCTSPPSECVPRRLGLAPVCESALQLSAAFVHWPSTTCAPSNVSCFSHSACSRFVSSIHPSDAWYSCMATTPHCPQQSMMLDPGGPGACDIAVAVLSNSPFSLPLASHHRPLWGTKWCTTCRPTKQSSSSLHCGNLACRHNPLTVGLGLTSGAPTQHGVSGGSAAIAEQGRFWWFGSVVAAWA